ncbi:GNAT domain and Acyl-CoA N-acyltransferase domain-containing protein [Strongyloides ratti]|uniref:GNAT domain and Acyl-CoA N-acyltransferase domain-containing protein n=2 Tax=Strongyloides ratti TaxID=34506 RepID=A0A090LGL0_STRRB|nr:GNAT domain and Acyl-CoA N-acyltransferase domain-containing protein [Strongyloides ratti]XP_024508119.1 GNAT domain and Acyl-CoA N-acyltransferase domain-containing protein [Strongyloides ratti]CEF68917.1 GNAT domain and Acyl-CoA N-acyltransferase domain-containing protein [Strongyloides ratti]CEF68919.1 GNAT domain and Acyl-CoA N-acyltransferase domain-containing protein [Strongyloides ratti]
MNDVVYYTSNKGINFEIRKANENDCDMIFGLIQELAEFEKMPHEVEMTVEKLQSDLKKEAFFCFIVTTKTDEGKIVPAGMNLFFLGYSTWKGQFIHMEDLYIRPNYRRSGLGEFLIKHLVDYALLKNIKRIEWAVLEWNINAINLYKKIGAVDMHEKEQWVTYRLSGEQLKALV